MKTTLTRAFLTLSAALMLLTLCASAARAQEKKDDRKEPDGTMLFGKDIAFIVKPPEGWVVDSESSAKQGVTAFFYPKGSSWKESVVFMYVNAVCRCGSKSLEEFIDGDLKKFQEHSPELKVSDGPAMKLEGGQEVPVKLFNTGSRVESVVYVMESESVLIFVLTSRTQKDHDASTGLFNQLISSYRLFGTFPNKD